MLTGEWKKSSRSGNTGGNCVEARWKKSSRSGNNGGNCVEVRGHGGVVQVRDTKLGEGSPILDASPADWRGFLAAVAELDPSRPRGARAAIRTASGPGAVRLPALLVPRPPTAR